MGRSLDLQLMEQVVEVYDECGGSASRISREFGITYHRVLNCLKAKALKPSGRQNPEVKYRGSDTPIDYFYDNFERFKRKSRRELAKADCGFYKTLLRWGALGFVIPYTCSPGRPSFSKEKIRQIVLCHSKYSGNRRKTARELKVDPSRVAKYWAQEGLVATGKPGRPRKK